MPSRAVAPVYAETSSENIALKRFVALANSGKLRGSSRGAQAARKVALAFLEHGLGLGDAEIDGLVEFLRFAKAMPDTARDVIDGWK